jgi:hypothetical protein
MMGALLLILIPVVILQGSIKRHYFGYGIKTGDVVTNDKPEYYDSSAVRIYWTETSDSFWAQAIIIPMKSKPSDTLDFVRLPNFRTWTLSRLNGKEDRHYIHGLASTTNDTIKISLAHGFSATTYYAKRDSSF